jgi:hypothetical protein
MPLRRALSALCLTAALAACASDPASRCAPDETRELQTVDRLIAETRSEIERGYRMVPDAANPSVNVCVGGAQSNLGISFCSDPGSGTRPAALDTEASTRTLDALLARRERLEARIASAVATCPSR